MVYLWVEVQKKSIIGSKPWRWQMKKQQQQHEGADKL